MSMMRALALMGTGAEGFMKGQRDEEAAQRARDQDAFQKTQQQFTLGEQQRVMQQRTDMAAALNDPAANAPAAGQPAQPVPAAPLPAPDPGGADANAPQQEFGGPMQALASGAADRPAGQPRAAPASPAAPAGPMQAAVGPKPAAPVGDPGDAQLQRQIAVISKYDPVAGMAMQAHAMTAKAAKIDLAHKEFSSQIGAAAAKGWDGLIDFTNKSGASPEQHRFVPNPDGKTGQVMNVLPDGSMVPKQGWVFDNTPEGALRAAGLLDQGIPVQAKAAHLLAQEKENRESRGQQATAKWHEAMGSYYDRLASVKEDANDIKADALAAKNPLAKMSEADKVTLLDLNKQLELINSERVKAQTAGMWQQEGPGAKAIQNQEATLMIQRRMLLAQYKAGGAPAATDPLGLRSGAKVDPATQAARDADRLPILQAELASAKAPEDRAAIQREIDRLPGAAKAGAKPAALPATAKPALGPMQAAMTPVAAVPAASTGLPGETEGSALDRARAATGTAHTKLMGYGSWQRKSDPRGFAAAQKAHNDAKAAEEAATAAYSAALAASPVEGPMTRLARP